MSQISENKKTDTNSIGIKLFLSLIVLTVSLLAGCIGGNIYYDLTVEPTPEWRNLGSPPEPVVELAGAEFFTVYVKGASGQLYSCYWESPYAHDCWNKVDEVQEYVNFCVELDSSEPDLPQPPFETPIESIYTEECFTWAGRPHYSLAVYHLLNNGDVAQWSQNDAFPLITGYFGKFLLNSFIGTVTGFAAGIYFSVRIWRSTKV